MGQNVDVLANSKSREYIANQARHNDSAYPVSLSIPNG
tara:strand:- start:517 stop:630 length:114 start_codon:yes stop_codon:yes gene_type:complete